MPVFEDAFSDNWGPLLGYPTNYFVMFERDTNGQTSGIRVSGTRVKNLHFIRQNTG